jgi:hypothetical protein
MSTLKDVHGTTVASPQETVPDAIYVCKADGVQHGPFTAESILAMNKNGAGWVFVWYEGLEEWQLLWKVPFLTPAASQKIAKPVRTKVATNDVAVWILAFAPILGALVELAFGFDPYPTLALNLGLCVLDGVLLKKAGFKTPDGWWYFLIPGYIYKRARMLNHSLLYFWVWIATFVATVLYSASPTVPKVDDPEIVTTLRQALEESQGLKELGVIPPITVTNPTEVRFDRLKQKRIAHATLTTNLGSDQVFYSVEWQNRYVGTFMVRVLENGD